MEYKGKRSFEKKKPAALNEQEDEETTVVEGRNAVLELLRSDKSVDKVFIASDIKGKMSDIFLLAKEKGAVIINCDRKKLDSVTQTGVHQGVIAYAAAREYVQVEDILHIAEERNEKPLIVICEGITDPHNLGAIIRSAETAGAHGIIIPKRRAVGLTAVVAKASSGAVEHMAISKVSNIAMTIEKLKEKGVWIFGADAEGDTNLYKAGFDGATAIVIGSEGEGLSRIVREKCDFIVSIPMKGKVNSLNASTAAAVLIYEAVRQRITED